MTQDILKQLRPAVVLLLIMTVLTGAVYPLVITGFGAVFFPNKAEGSLIERDGVVVGSSLVGQEFTDPAYFWSRPSATGPVPYNAAASSGSNYGPLSEALVANVVAEVELLQADNLGDQSAIPVDLVTASGSGLDPHISPAAATYQISRVAAQRGVSEDNIRELVDKYTEERDLLVLGEPRVNVLLLNLALDERFPR